jgi:hypothetical protein
MARGYHTILEEHYDRLTGQEMGGGAAGNLKPFFPVAQKEDGDVLEWLEDNLRILEDEQEERARGQIRNVRFYKGIQDLGNGMAEAQMIRNGSSRPVTKSQMFTLNHCRDLVHQKVARLMRFNPDMNVTPQNNEYTDRLGAKLSKRVIDNLFYINDSRAMFSEALQHGALTGESFVFVEWDPYIGDKDPMVERIRNEGLVKEFTDNQGEVIPLDMISRVGDVSYKNPLSWLVWHEPQVKWKDVNYIYYAEIKHIDEIRAENPNIDLDHSSIITLTANKEGGYGPGFQLGEYTVQYTFYHKRHRFLDSGFMARFIPGQLLYRGPLPYSHGELPVARFTDFDDPESAHGISFLEDIKPPLVLFNKLWNLTYRNIAIGAHPKLFVPEGSCNINSMANGPFVVEYQYPMKPELVTFPTLTPEVITVPDKLMGQISQLSGTFGVSRGETIANARAASILNFYEEQEAKREESQTRKKNAFCEKLARLSLGTAGDKYKPDDGRMIRIVGKNNRYKVRKVDDVAKLSGPYDVKVEFTTALAETKQGRIDQISTLSNMPLSQNKNEESKPGLFTREQVLRMIEVADIDEFFEMATASAECAESENEDMFEGEPVEAPEKFQMHIVHWNTHFQFLQSREFADVKGVPQEVKEGLLNHLMTHEMWMYELAQKSLTFAQLLMENFYFPAVFEIGAQPTIAQLVMMHQQPPAPPPGAEPPPEAAQEEAPEEEQAPPPEAAPEDMPPEMPMEPPPPPAPEAPKQMIIQRGPDGKISGAIIVPVDVPSEAPPEQIQ